MKGEKLGEIIEEIGMHIYISSELETVAIKGSKRMVSIIVVGFPDVSGNVEHPYDLIHLVIYI